MTGYLKWCGMGNTEQSGFRALGALAGLFASIIFPFLIKRMKLTSMGIVGIYAQLFCLASMTFSRPVQTFPNTILPLVQSLTLALTLALTSTLGLLSRVR